MSIRLESSVANGPYDAILSFMPSATTQSSLSLVLHGKKEARKKWTHVITVDNKQYRRVTITAKMLSDAMGDLRGKNIVFKLITGETMLDMLGVHFESRLESLITRLCDNNDNKYDSEFNWRY